MTSWHICTKKLYRYAFWGLWYWRGWKTGWKRGVGGVKNIGKKRKGTPLKLMPKSKFISAHHLILFTIFRIGIGFSHLASLIITSVHQCRYWILRIPSVSYRMTVRGSCLSWEVISGMQMWMKPHRMIRIRIGWSGDGWRWRWRWVVQILCLGGSISGGSTLVWRAKWEARS